MKTIKLFYYNEVSNFGDLLNLKILSQLSKANIVSSIQSDCNFLAIGSLLEQFLWAKKNNLKLYKNKYLSSKMFVWGSGFISPPDTIVIRPDGLSETFFRKMDFLAVRGKTTKSRVEKILHKKLDNIVLGDPGLLASKLIDTSSIIKKYSLGIIPHYIDKNISIFNEINRTIKGSTIIDVQNDPILVVQNIAECEVVISTAMHGLIVADSLGVPNKWCTCSDNLTGGSYKFLDYYSSLDIKDIEPLDLLNTKLEQMNVYAIQDNYISSVDKIKIIQQRLIDVFNGGNIIPRIK